MEMNGGRAFGRQESADRAKRKGFHVVPDANTTVVGERASSAGVVLFSAVLFALCFCIVLGAAQIATGSIGVMAVVVALVVALLAVSSVHIAQRGKRWSCCG